MAPHVRKVLKEAAGKAALQVDGGFAEQGDRHRGLGHIISLRVPGSIYPE